MKKLILLFVIALGVVSCTAEPIEPNCGKIISKGWNPGKGTYIKLDINPGEEIYCNTENLEGGDIYCK